ncbi:unnamed protein product [Paramecium sonneborni]|uniref:Uncharacterized protein n=1 Tax=Paramecium sonneborni TaxID=65129 RepID=A0A8S1PFK2_9CILI|nr:unnamed protein product [Paramecium sonneborni]
MLDIVKSLQQVYIKMVKKLVDGLLNGQKIIQMMQKCIDKILIINKEVMDIMINKMKKQENGLNLAINLVCKVKSFLVVNIKMVKKQENGKLIGEQKIMKLKRCIRIKNDFLN